MSHARMVHTLLALALCAKVERGLVPSWIDRIAYVLSLVAQPFQRMTLADELGRLYPGRPANTAVTTRRRTTIVDVHEPALFDHPIATTVKVSTHRPWLGTPLQRGHLPPTPTHREHKSAGGPQSHAQHTWRYEVEGGREKKIQPNKPTRAARHEEASEERREPSSRKTKS